MAEPSPAALDLDRIAELAARFDSGKRCDTEAIAELRAMKDGVPPPELADALVTAYTACDEPSALADLLRETMPVEATSDRQLQVGIALVKATRYAEAVALLVPLAEHDGPQSKAAWLAGFALFHGGESARALPYLQGARAHGGPVDASTLIGIALLHAGDTEGAIAELEAGLAVGPDNVSLLAALGRAYEEAGRREDANRLAQRTREAQQLLADDERRKLRLSGLGHELADAQTRGDRVEQRRIIAGMLELDPPTPVRTKLSALQDQLARGDAPP